jgi:hypothetical protein
MRTGRTMLKIFKTPIVISKASGFIVTLTSPTEVSILCPQHI